MTDGQRNVPDNGPPDKAPTSTSAANYWLAVGAGLVFLGVMFALSWFVLGQLADSLVPEFVLVAVSVLAGAVAVAASPPRRVWNSAGGRFFLAVLGIEIALFAVGLPTLRIGGSQMGWPLVAFIFTGWLPFAGTTWLSWGTQSPIGKAAWVFAGLGLLGAWLYAAHMLVVLSII